MSEYESRPPHWSDSTMNARTRRLRPPLPLSEERAAEARDIRKRHPDLHLNDIAMLLGVSPEAVRYALATLRTANPASTRKTLNVTTEAAAFIRRHAHPGEPVWATVDRLFRRLADLPRGGV